MFDITRFPCETSPIKVHHSEPRGRQLLALLIISNCRIRKPKRNIICSSPVRSYSYT